MLSVIENKDDYSESVTAIAIENSSEKNFKVIEELANRELEKITMNKISSSILRAAAKVITHRNLLKKIANHPHLYYEIQDIAKERVSELKFKYGEYPDRVDTIKKTTDNNILAKLTHSDNLKIRDAAIKRIIELSKSNQKN